MKVSKERTFLYLVYLVSFLGTFWPTSFGGNINAISPIVGVVFCIGFIFSFSVLNNIILNNVLPGLLLLFLLLFFSITSDLPEINLGALGPYLAIAALFVLDFRKLRDPLALRVFALLSILILLLAVGVILEFEVVIGLIEEFFQQYYTDLFKQTVIWYSKPVGVYGTHSVAALVYFCFSMVCLYISLSSKKTTPKLLFIILSLLFWLVIPFLKSVSAVILFLVMSAIFSVALFKARPRVFLLFTMVTSIILLNYYLNNSVSINSKFELAIDAVNILSSDANGFKGRYLSNSRLGGTFEYLSNHPFSGVGITSSSVIEFGDSLFSEYILRISFVGYFTLLIGLYLFLNKNLTDPKLVFPIFIFFLLTDLGYPLLTTFKFIVVLPLLIVVLNSCQKES